jgi:hypothetical protein
MPVTTSSACSGQAYYVLTMENRRELKTRSCDKHKDAFSETRFCSLVLTREHEAKPGALTWQILNIVLGQVENHGWSLGLLQHYQTDTGTVLLIMPITVAKRSEVWTVFAPWTTELVGSNPVRGTDVCVHLFRVCAVLCVITDSGWGWSPVKWVLPTVY